MLYVFDANALIALIALEHVHHPRVSAWASGIDRFAVCPMVEGGFVRFATRLGASARESQEALRVVHRRPGFQFLPDSLSYADVALGHVRGHRQVTDAYLASLAVTVPGGRLATLDHGLVADLGESGFLIPEI